MTAIEVIGVVTGRAGLRSGWRGAACAGLVAAGGLLTGCGSVSTGGNTGTPIPAPYSGPTFTVAVMAGMAPLVGATVQFYTAGTTGNGSAATALLSAAVVTDSRGMAKVPANYTCPTGTGLVYLKASGGTAGGSPVNTATVLLGAVGACSSVTTTSSFVVNEATTVAAGYALQAFYAGGNIGASATNLTGLTNAFATAGTLANPITGSAAVTTLPANGESATTRMNTVANALNACVTRSSACAALYAEAPNGNPADTFEAVVDLARYPAKNVAAIYAEALLSTAYAPRLLLAPLDWTMFVNYSGGGLNAVSPMKVGVSGIALDSGGNVWVSAYFGVATKFSPIGTPLFANGITGSGLNNSFGAAVDLNDNAWIPNEQPYTSAGIGSVSVLTAAGDSAAGSAGYINGGLNYPISIAIDPNGTAWIVDYGNSHLTLLSKTGAPLSGASGYTTPLFAFPVVVAVDGNHFGWVGNQADTTVTKVSPDGSSYTNYSCCDAASGIAIDASNNVWIANFYGDSVSMINAAGVVVANQAYKGAGQIDHPQGIAIDGAGSVFVANYRQAYLTELAGAGATVPGAALSPASGVGGDAQLLEPFALAVDASGNVWVTNQGSDIVTKYIGLGMPVKTPLSGLPKAP